MSLSELKKRVKQLKNPEKAVFLQRFFKTGKGQYVEGDIFLGIAVPDSRKIAKEFGGLSFEDIRLLLSSTIHEERLIALFILVHQYQKGDDVQKESVYTFYLSNTQYINNWDLVDSSADKIIGEHLLTTRHSGELAKGNDARISSVKLKIDRSWSSQDDNIVLEKLARSQNLWERRIAMIATYAFIKKGRADEAFKIAEILIHDKHDLIQKAVGWMLREVGKRVSPEIEEEFLKKHYKSVGRTALRYAIEHFDGEKRKQYLLGTIL